MVWHIIQGGEVALHSRTRIRIDRSIAIDDARYGLDRNACALRNLAECGQSDLPIIVVLMTTLSQE
jgi:hypothetical protein